MADKQQAQQQDRVCWINNCPTILYLPDRVTIGKASDESARILGVGTGRALMMGRNHLTRDEAKAYREHAVVKSWFKVRLIGTGKPMLEESDDVSQPEGVPSPDSLLSYGVPAACALVEGEERVETLERWLDAEQRPQVMDALKRRLATLGAGGRIDRAAIERELRAKIERENAAEAARSAKGAAR